MVVTFIWRTKAILQPAARRLKLIAFEPARPNQSPRDCFSSKTRHGPDSLQSMALIEIQPRPKKPRADFPIGIVASLYDPGNGRWTLDRCRGRTRGDVP